MSAGGQGTNRATSPMRLAGFDYRRIDVEGVTINCGVEGAGPPPAWSTPSGPVSAARKRHR